MEDDTGGRSSDLRTFILPVVYFSWLNRVGSPEGGAGLELHIYWCCLASPECSSRGSTRCFMLHIEETLRKLFCFIMAFS